MDQNMMLDVARRTGSVWLTRVGARDLPRIEQHAMLTEPPVDDCVIWCEAETRLTILVFRGGEMEKCTHIPYHTRKTFAEIAAGFLAAGMEKFRKQPTEANWQELNLKYGAVCALTPPHAYPILKNAALVLINGFGHQAPSEGAEPC